MGIRLLDVHVCNDRDLMTEYHDKPIRIGGSTSDGGHRVEEKCGDKSLSCTRVELGGLQITATCLLSILDIRPDQSRGPEAIIIS